MNKAVWADKVTVTDPQTGFPVEIEIYKHQNGGMFGVDSSFIDQVCDDDTYPVIPDPFSNNGNVQEVQFVMLREY